MILINSLKFFDNNIKVGCTYQYNSFSDCSAFPGPIF